MIDQNECEIGIIYPEYCMMVSPEEERRWRLTARLKRKLQAMPDQKDNFTDLATLSIQAELSRFPQI